MSFHFSRIFLIAESFNEGLDREQSIKQQEDSDKKSLRLQHRSFLDDQNARLNCPICASHSSVFLYVLTKFISRLRRSFGVDICSEKTCWTTFSEQRWRRIEKEKRKRKNKCKIGTKLLKPFFGPSSSLKRPFPSLFNG